MHSILTPRETVRKTRLREYLDRIAPERDRWKKRSRYYHSEMAKLMRFLVPEDASVLEVGCGTGDLLAALRPRRCAGVDLSPRMVEIAKQKYPQLVFHVGDAEKLPLRQAFDYVILSDLVGFLEDIEQSFRELHTVTQAASRIVVTYYNYLWEPVLKLAERLHWKMPQPTQNWLAAEDIENLLALTDFEVVKRGWRMLLPLSMPILSWVANRYLAELPGLRRLCLVQYLVARPLPLASRSTREHTTSIVVPARNEEGTIEQLVERLPRWGRKTEIIFVEGHSTDGTREEIQRVRDAHPEWDIKLLIQQGTGKGDAVREGLDAAKGDILMILDADLSVRPEDLPKFYEALVAGKGEFLMGSRLVYPLEEESMRLLNIFGNKFFSELLSWLLGHRIKDTLCGTKVLWRKDYERIKRFRHLLGDFDPFGDFDLIFGAARLNLKIVEIPVRYQPRQYGRTNIQRFRHGWLLLRMSLIAMRKLKFI